MIMYYMNDQEGFQVFIDKIMGLLSYYILFHPNENITIAFCCSAGEYRSPAVADTIAKKLKKLKVDYKLEQSKNSKL